MQQPAVSVRSRPRRGLWVAVSALMPNGAQVIVAPSPHEVPVQNKGHAGLIAFHLMEGLLKNADELPLEVVGLFLRRGVTAHELAIFGRQGGCAAGAHPDVVGVMLTPVDYWMKRRVGALDN